MNNSVKLSAAFAVGAAVLACTFRGSLADPRNALAQSTFRTSRPQDPAPEGGRRLQVVDPQFDPARLAVSTPNARNKRGVLCCEASDAAPPIGTEGTVRAPTEEELAGSPLAIRQLFSRLRMADPILTPNALRRLLPDLPANEARLLDGSMVLAGKKRRVGCAFITADMATLRRHERDFVAYREAFADTYSRVEGSHYLRGQDRNGEWAAIQISQTQSGVVDVTVGVSVLEHWVGGQLVVDYGLRCGYVRNGAGVDLYYPVADATGLFGYFVVTIFGYEECDFFGEFEFHADKVGQDIADNLGYLARAGKR